MTPLSNYLRERSRTLCIGGWLGPYVGLHGCGNIPPAGIPTPHRPGRGESLYRLSYPRYGFVSEENLNSLDLCVKRKETGRFVFM